MPKVATHASQLGTVAGVQFWATFQSVLIGLLLQVALSANEYHTAARLKRDYWLYVVFNCGSIPELHVVQDPARLGWQVVMAVAHYHVGPQAILSGEIK